jgi:hypothetical protein
MTLKIFIPLVIIPILIMVLNDFTMRSNVGGKMKGICKLIFIAFLMITISIINTACDEGNIRNHTIAQNDEKELVNNSPNNERNDPTGQVNHEHLAQGKNVQESDPFLDTVRTAVNDELWYNGEYSQYRAFENQVTSVSIYQKGKKDKIVLFEQPTTYGYYISIAFPSTKKGYDNEITNSMLDFNKEKLKSNIEKQKYQLLKTTQLIINKASQPSYPAMSSEREKVIENIGQSIVEYLHDKELFPIGNYKYYIRNYRDIESSTKVVIEGGNKTWIVNANVEEGSKGGVMGKLNEVDNLKEALYQVDQYKTASVAMNEVSNVVDSSKSTAIEQENKRETYTSKRFGISVTLPVSWKGKYEVIEKEKGAFFYFLPENKRLEKAELFDIQVWGTESKWNEWWNEGGKDMGVPFRKIGVINGQVYIQSGPTEAIYQGLPEAKKEGQEYDKLLGGIDAIMKSFKVIE